jgi:hypothetical protein
LNLHWFERTKTQPVSKHRPEVDSIRRVLRYEEKLIKKNSNYIYQGLVILAALVLLANFSFFGTVTAQSIKNKAGALKMFENGSYLVIFQNNAEMRPTGGFIGTFAVVAFADYKIKKIDFNTNIYKLDNAFTALTQVAPPDPLSKITEDKWALRDSNFDVNFPEAAADIRWFYEQESGQKVDGVIAINASIISDLLRLTGPVYVSKYDTTITADNFFDEMAQKIEKEYFYDKPNQSENEPKTILKDIMPILADKAFDLPKVKLAKLAADSMDQKQILLQSNNSQIQKAILANNWGGEIQSTNSDYLAINNANITDLKEIKNGGAKTSLKIKELINYQIGEIDGQLQSNLTLTRSHTGSYIWPDGANMNWTRILVPKGSSLIKAELNGKDITDEIEINYEAGKTYFATWINTNPQTSSVLNISYKPNIENKNYSLLLQSQPGNLGDDLTVNYKDKTIYKGFFNQDLKLKAK